MLLCQQCNNNIKCETYKQIQDLGNSEMIQLDIIIGSCQNYKSAILEMVRVLEIEAENKIKNDISITTKKDVEFVGVQDYMNDILNNK